MSAKNETKRFKILENYNILDSLREEEFDRITELAAMICGVPISLISLLDENRQWFKSKIGIDIDETPKNIAFCKHTIQDFKILEVEDTLNDERFRQNPLVTSQPNIRFYAGYPLTEPGGYNLGTLCVIDRKPKRLSDEQKKALKLLAESTVSLIVQRRKNQELLQFEKLFTLSSDLVCVADVDGYLKRVNPAFVQVLGWTDKYLYDTPFFGIIHPDDQEATQRELELLKAGKPTINFAIRFKCADGSYKVIEWVATPEQSTGNIFAIGRDITRERENDVLLSNSENKFKTFFESSQSLMCTFHLDGRILTINRSGARALGFSPEELLGENLNNLIEPKFREQFEEHIKELKTKGQSSASLCTKHKEGSSLIWLFDSKLQKDFAGDEYIFGNAINITERYKLEADLKLTKEMLEQTNTVARIGAWEVDLVKNEISWSNVTREIHEVDEDFVPDLSSALSFFKGQDAVSISEAINQSIKNQKGYDLELQITTGKGTQKWVRAIGTPEFKKGECIRLYGTFQDIDARKKAEQELLTEKNRLAAFVEHAPAAVAMFDSELNYIAVSRRWMDEYHLEGNIIGKSHYEVFPNVSKEWKAIHARCLAGAVEKKEEDIWRPYGWTHDQHLRWEVRPWYQYDGSIGGVMMLTQDITEASMQKAELERAKIQAEQASIAKSEFLANMSHEIRTPLNGVIGFTDLLLKTSLDAVQQQYLSIVNQSANSLLGIINDILDFSKIESGKLELDIDKIDLWELCNQAVDIISYQVKQKGLKMILNLPENLPRFVMADSIRLKQILVNLLGNAVKFTTKGEIELSLFLLEQNGHNNFVRIAIRDTGIGIKQEMQSKIFEAFSQEDNSTTKRYGGTGLGLTISNKLLSLMDSKLQLKSMPGEGSVFYFEIDLVNAEALKKNIQVPAELPFSKSNFTNTIKKVLIVDDNPVNKLLARTIILRLSDEIAIFEADNGEEALVLFTLHEPELILMDIQMQEMNGIEATKAIRKMEKGRKVPIIALTAASVKGERENCINAGMNDYVLKPFTEETLKVVLQKYSGTKSSEWEDIIPEPSRPIDLNVIKTFLGNDESLLQEYVQLAIQELINSQLMLQKGLDAKDLSVINSAGHRIYGTSGTLGCQRLCDTAKSLELLSTFDEETIDEGIRIIATEIGVLIERFNAV